MLSKIRHYVPGNTLCTIYYGIFSSLLTYCAPIWGQIQNKNINRIIRLQNKALRTINFAQNRDSTNILYQNSKILKFNDQIRIQNFMLVHDSIKGNLPSAFDDVFKTVQSRHCYNTRNASQHQKNLPKVNTLIYGLNSIRYRAIKTWNDFVNKFHMKNLHCESKITCKRFITKSILESY